MDKLNLYGIETDTDCRRELDELTELNRIAQEHMDKDSVAAIKARLKFQYRKGNSERGRAQMSAIESAFFWPAINEAYVNAPNLNSRQTWREGLSNIEYYLNYYKPPLPK
jgi:hypothetical protein